MRPEALKETTVVLFQHKHCKELFALSQPAENCGLSGRTSHNPTLLSQIQKCHALQNPLAVNEEVQKNVTCGLEIQVAALYIFLREGAFGLVDSSHAITIERRPRATKLLSSVIGCFALRKVMRKCTGKGVRIPAP